MISQPQILDNFKFFAGADVDRTVGTGAGTVAAPSNLAQGELVITDASNVILDSTSVLTTTSPIKIVMGRGAGVALWESQLFTYKDIQNYTGIAFAPKVQQVSYYGYNGVTGVGSFSVINDNYYTMVISFYELLSQEASSLMNPILVDYLSDASATQAEVANGLYRNLVRQLSYWTRRPILAELINANTGNIAAPAGSVITWVQGSPLVSCSLTGTFVAGDYVRLGTGVNDPVYLITQVVTNTSFTLAYPAQTSGTLTQPNWEGITAAGANAANFGIKVSGLNQPFILDSRPVSLVNFQIGISGGGSTNLSYQVGAFIGHGTYEQMRTLEASSWRNQGQLFTYTEFPPTTVQTDLIVSQDHSTLNLVLSKPNKALTNTDFRQQLCIACALDANVPHTFKTSYTGGAGDGIVDVLDAYVVNFTNLTAQIGNL
jgi:hypothetical protein